MNILNLNDDELIQIFSYLVLDDLKSLSYTSNRFDNIIEDYFFKKIVNVPCYQDKIFRKKWSNWDLIRINNNWMNGIYSQNTFFNHKLGQCIKLQLNSSNLYITDHGKIRVYTRNKKFFDDQFRVFGSESHPGVSALCVKDGDIFYGNFEGNCSLVLKDIVEIDNSRIHSNFESVRFVDFHRANSVLLSASHSEIKVMSLSSELGVFEMEPLNQISGNYITCLKMNNEGNKFVRGDLQNVIKNDIHTGKEEYLNCVTDGVLDVIWKDDFVILTSHKDGSLRVFDLRTNQDEQMFYSVSNWNVSLDFDGKNGVLCGYRNSKKVNLYDLRKSEVLTTFGPFTNTESSSVLGQIVSDGHHLLIAMSFNVFGLDFTDCL